MPARSASFAASADAVPRARRFVVDVLAGWQVDPAAVDDLELVASELVTNAFLHGAAERVDVDLAGTGDLVRLEVAHREAAPNPARESDALAPLTVDARAVHGRGLAIVDVLADRWGVSHRAATRRVWAELAAARTGLLPARDRADALAELAAELATLAAPSPVGEAGELAGAFAGEVVGDTVAAWAKRRLGTVFVGVAVPDATPGFLRYLQVDPLPAPTARRWTRFPAAADAPVAGCFRTGRPTFHETRSAAVASFPSLGPTLAEADVTAIANLPLPAPAPATGCLGVLTLTWAQGQRLDPDDRDWLAGVGRLTAAALAAATG